MEPQFFEIFDMQGFDDETNPPWQMVPVDGDRYVLLADSADLTIRSEYPPIAMWHEVKAREIPGGGHVLMPGVRAFRLHSGSKGSTSILAYERSRVVARLDVDTKFVKTLRITFNFVTDKAGEKTVHNPAEAMQWVRELNQIFQQCNIQVVCRSARWVSIDADLGWVIRIFSPSDEASEKEKEEQNLLVAKRDLGADVNVFHFNDFRPGYAAEHIAAAITPFHRAKCLFINDDAPNYVNTLAHEIGHTQGLRHSDRENALMNRWDSDGAYLNKDEVNTINP